MPMIPVPGMKGTGSGVLGLDGATDVIRDHTGTGTWNELEVRGPGSVSRFH